MSEISSRFSNLSLKELVETLQSFERRAHELQLRVDRPRDFPTHDYEMSKRELAQKEEDIAELRSEIDRRRS